ncbi:MAG: glycosyl transferase [Lachnospiraceae bacterium]|jgi:hypothetical protein|nr:glycosyl transferase [Lachnospiraceae bacterium]
MIGTELLKGQGLGNQLFCYVTVRCIALEQELPFAILGADTMANNIHSTCGLYFMELDYGIEAEKRDFMTIYCEKEERLFLGNSRHDLLHGCYITGTDQAMMRIADRTLLSGNMQSEDYYIKYKDQIREWLQVKEEYDTMEYSRDNLCILHLRCSDYLDCPELYLRRSYWLRGIKNMRRIRSDMEFMIITNDVREAGKILPGIPAYNFDLATDYAILKNARYLLLANSSFAYFPAFTSTMIKYIIAPKYWARYNVSDGYWASEQNIYTGWHYQDRHGRLFSAEECRQELRDYKERKRLNQKINQRPHGLPLLLKKAKAECIYYRHYLARRLRGLLRHLRKN